jgi:hypothetical protein
MKVSLSLMLLFIAAATASPVYGRIHIIFKPTNIIETRAPVQDTIPYATLYFYRSYIPKLNAPLKKVPIYINDSLFHELKYNTMFAIKIIKEGRYNIAIDKKGESDFPVKIKMGQEYFFKCSVEKGLWFGKPTIEPISVKEGKIDAGLIKENEKSR